MKLKLDCGDITLFKGDAIVNAANSSLLGGGGVDGAIHRAAGPNLLKECIKLRGCRVGEAKITNGYNLSVKYVIHTAGPIWRDGTCGEQQLLQDCFNNSVKLAKENGVRSIAFPLISAGVYGYPVTEALRVAITTLSQYDDEDISITLVLYDTNTYAAACKVMEQVYN